MFAPMDVELRTIWFTSAPLFFFVSMVSQIASTWRANAFAFVRMTDSFISFSPFNHYLLNELVKRIEEVDEDEHYKLAALIELAAPSDFDSIYRIIDHLDEYDFLSEIQDDYALGRYFAIDCDMLHGTPEHLKYYFHFESFGFSMKLKHGIKYTSLGAIYRK